jgi:hypothetical protein
MRDSLSFRTLTGAVKLMAVGLVAALMVGGAAIAGNGVGNKIDGSQLLNESVGGSKLKEGAVKKKHLGQSARNFILKQGDGTAGGPGLPGQNGQDGQDGQDGEDGEDGLDGEDGVAGYEVVQTTHSFGPNGWGGWDCPEDKVALGGGFAGAPVQASRPHEPGDVLPHLPSGATGHGWSVQAGGSGGEITVFVVCAEVG